MKVILCKGRFAGPISGADETVVAYAIHLKSAGFDVAVAVLFPFAADDPYVRRLREAGVRIDCVEQRSLAAKLMLYVKRRVPHVPPRIRRVLQQTALGVSYQCVRQCREYFENSHADLVHVVTPDPGAMAMIRAAHEARIPVLYQELGTPDFLPELNFYYERLREVLPLCDEIAALTPSLARRFGERLAIPSPVSVLPLLIEDVPSSAPKTTHGVTFGFAARMEYGKGPLSLVDAFTQVRRAVGGVSLRMAGSGPQRPEVEALARGAGLNGAFSLAGTYSGPAQRLAFMQSIDVFVLPTLAEGTPNGIIEAMAHGLPVIASAVGGIPETVSAEAGMLVEPGNRDALVEAMITLASDPERRAAMGRAARRHYEENFSARVVMPVLTDLYGRVAGSFGP